MMLNMVSRGWEYAWEWNADEVMHHKLGAVGSIYGDFWEECVCGGGGLCGSPGWDL